MAYIILMRHGQTIANTKQIYQGQGNSPLSSQGKKQAAYAATLLKNAPLDAIYCSDLVRATDTAKAIAKYHKTIKITRLKSLRERYFGKWEGLGFEEIKNNYPRILKTWTRYPAAAKIPGAETLAQLKTRAVAAIKKIAKKHRDKTILVVAHGGINRSVLFHFLNLSQDNFWKVKQDNCCINTIEFDRGIWRVSLINGTCLPEDFFLERKDILA